MNANRALYWLLLFLLSAIITPKVYGQEICDSRQLSAIQSCATPNETPFNLILPFTNLSNPKFILQDGKFEEFDELGTATLAGTLVNIEDSNIQFSLELNFSQRSVDNSITVNHECLSNIDNSGFYYYKSFNGLILGINDMEGAYISVRNSGNALQLGYGANWLDKTLAFGAGSKCLLKLTGNPKNGFQLARISRGGSNFMGTIALGLTDCNPCALKGGDTDGDGICDEEDCAPDNKDLPASAGTACDDGDANTINDVIQADRCECKGVEKGDITFDCNDNEITATATYGTNGTTVDYTLPTAITTCGSDGLAVVLSEGLESGQTFPIGTTTVIYTATDDCGNEEKCSFNIIVKEGDKGNIDFDCKETDITATAIYGAEGTTVEYRIPTAETTCELNGLDVVLTEGFASGQTFPIGTTTVIYTATDDCGNEEKCSFDIIVKEGDKGNIAFNCNNEDIIATAIYGAEGTTVEYRIPTAETTCELNGLKVVLSDGLESGKTFPIGTTTVVYTATDDCGNEEKCSFDITVKEGDSGNITFDCKEEEITATAVFGTEGTTVEYRIPTAETTCELNGLKVVLSDGLESGKTFPIGTTTVTYIATDDCDNKEECTFKVTVTEGADPCAGDNSPIVTVAQKDPDCAGDNGEIIFSFAGRSDRTQIEFSLDGGQTYPLNVSNHYNSRKYDGLEVGEYDIFVRWGNNDCPVDLDIITLKLDKETPGSTCDDGDAATINDVIQEDGCDCKGVEKGAINFTCNEEEITATAIYGATGTTVEYRTPTAETTCELNGLDVVLTEGFASGQTFPIGTTTVIYTATDDCGNEEKCSFDITVKAGDKGNIAFNCNNEDITATATYGATGTIVEYRLPTAETTCELNGLKVVLSEGLESGKTFPIGTTTVTYIATDECDNKKECSFDITVKAGDKGNIAFNCNNEDIIATATYGATGTIVEYRLPTAETTCELNGLKVVLSEGLESGKTFPIGTTTVTYIATDECDNKKECSFDITVKAGDKGNIAFDCNDNEITATAAFGTEGTTVEYRLPTAETTCELNGLKVVLSEGLESGKTFPIGTTTVTYIATDDCDNKEECTFKVTVTEADRCDELGGDTDGDGICDEEDCAPNNKDLPTQAGKACDDGDATTINDVIQADGCDCEGVKKGDITFACNDDITATASFGTNGVTVDYTLPTAVTTCALNGLNVVLTEGLASGSTFPIGTTIVTYTATDECDNKEACTFKVTVTEGADPCAGDNSPIVRVEKTDPVCSEDNGTITFYFEDHASRTNIEFSLDGGQTYPLYVADNAGSATFENLAAGDYDLFVRWGNDDCPVDLDKITLNVTTKTPGTTCDDGDEETIDDVIQEDGCDCIGEIDDGGPIIVDPNACTSRTAFNTTLCMGSSEGTLYGGYMLFRDLGYHYSLENGKFVEYKDGTANLTGEWINVQDPEIRFEVDVKLAGRTVSTPPNSPKSHNCLEANEADFYYYLQTAGTILGKGKVDGAKLSVGRAGPAFQFGVGANPTNSELNFGAAGWITLTIVNQPTTGMELELITSARGSNGDININLTGDPFTCVEGRDAISNTCVEDITVDAAAGSNGAVVNWETPTYSSNCIYNSNVDCSDAPNSVSGFEYVGELDGSKYFISTNTATYYEAKSKTIQEGGYLAVICSQAENDFITSKLNADVTWIGFSDEVTEGTFLWSNGHGCDYTNWLGSDPNDGHNTNEYTEADHTVIQHNSGGWLDRNGAAKYKYILEIPCTGAMPTGTAQMTQTEGPASGEVFPVGETTVAYEGVDACGNTVTCNFKVTVKEGAVDANVCTSRTAFNTNRCGDGTFAGIQYGGYLLLKDEGRHYSLSNGQFVEYNDGTASLTGTWTNIEDDQIVFDVDVTLSGRTANTPTDSPKEHNCINPDYSKFYYYLQTAGTLTGRNKVEGAKITIGRAGPAFQFGVGANPTNTEMNFGAAGWITAEIVKQPTTGSTISLEASSVGSNGDININLSGDPTACIEDRGGNTTFSCDGSLLTNPDFESGSENWWWASNISASSDAYFGSKAALANGGAGGVGQSIDAIPGAIYTLSVYAKKNATEDAVIGIKFYDANENELKANHLAITSSTYQSFGLSAKAPSNAVKVIAIGWKNEGPGKAWWDGFCFDKWTPTVADCNSNNSCALMPSYNDYIFSIGEGDHDNFMDYDNADLTFCDNGDGTISIKGSIINGRDAAWAANEVSPCGAKDGWYVDLTLSDMQDWSTFQGAYVVNDNCKDAYLGLDYWDVKGALKGIGCNTGRTLDVSGPAEGNGGYRMQIGQGGNSHNCDYGLSTWFEATENGNKVVMDIYAGIDAACYESMRPAVVDGPCAGDNAPQVTVNKTNPDCGQDNGKITFSFADHSTRTNIEFSLDGGQTYPLNVKDQAETAVFENLAAGQYDIYVRWGNDECPVNLGVVSLAGDNKAPGTACDDRNDATVNDVIQSDGCTCAGEVDDNGPLFENPCGTSNKAIETYIVGVKGQSNPCFDIPNPENVTKVTVELWVAGNTPPSTVEFTTAGGTTGARTAKPSGIQVLQAVGSGENEFLFRNTFDGNFSKVCTKYSGGRSMAIYVERDIEGAGSSIYVIDRELHSKNNIADCITLDAALPQSGGMRDIHFDIPVHEKGDTDRPVTVKIDIKDSNNNILDTKSQIFTEQNAGNEASLFSIEFQDVSDQAVNATITICSPTNNGESFGLGLITFTTNCTESGGSNDGECDDLLVNPSFEQSGLSPWSFNSNTSYNKSSRYRADGDYMVWIYKKYSHLKDAEIYQDATAIPGAKYSFTFYSGTHKPEFNHEVAIEFYNSYGAQLARKAVQIDFDVDGGDYLQEYFLEETAPTGTTKIRFVGTADGDYLKLDAICVQVDKTNAQVSGRAAPGVSGGTQEIGEVSFFELDEITLGSTVKREGIQLDWYSKNSSLPSKYVIEKSVDGKRFTRIQEITEIVDEHLTIIDDTPDYGTNSYRVIQEFENGQAVVSNIREEKYLLDPASITLYPNPVVHDLNLKIGHFSDLEGTIRIFSTMGQQVYEKTLDAQDKHLKINVSDLKNGMYFLIIEAKNRKPIERQFIVESLK